MIIYEILEGDLVRAYSDAGVLIHGGSPEWDYVEAIDPASTHRTYIETEVPIDADPISDSEALSIVTGGEYGATE